MAIENCNLDDKAIASYNAIMSVPSGYSIGSIQVGEELTVEKLLEVLLVHSANDAANVLGEHVGGSIESFANIMNTKALEIGCTNSHFVNPSGKHDDNHYTTARDLALMMEYCMKNETFRRISGMRSCTLPATDKSAERPFATTVEILIPDSRNVPYNYYYQYAIAGKTGFTTEAKNCLVSVSSKDGFELTSVILGADKTPEGYSSRFLETKAIYDYGYNNYSIKKIASKDSSVRQLEVPLATDSTKTLDALVSEDISALIKNSDDLSNIEPVIDIFENLDPPISEGQVIGTVSYTVLGVTYKTNLVASHTVEKSSFINIGILIILLIIVIIPLMFLLKFKKKAKKTGK